MWQIIIIVIGLIFGVFLSKSVKDEIKAGKRYFLILEKILLLIIILLFINRLDVLMVTGILIGLIICRFFKKIYFYFGIFCLTSMLINKELFLTVVALIFLFGLFYGSLEKFKLKKLALNVFMFILPFSLLAVESFINAKIGIFLGIGIGGIIEWARGSAW